MSHVFFIHSSITLKIALEIIKKDSIKKENIIFIGHRLQTSLILKEYRFIDLSNEFDLYKDFKFSLKLIKIWSKTNRLQNLISSLTKNQNFNLYIPQHSLNIFQILSNHKLCVGFSYLEEGVLAYVNYSKYPDYYSLKKSKNFFLDMLYWASFKGATQREKQYFYFNKKKFHHAYTINPKAFPLLKDRSRLRFFPNKPNHNKKVSKPSLLILEAIVEAGFIDLESYLKLITRTVNKKLKDSETISYKFHPRQSSKTKEKVLDIFNSFKESNNIFLELDSNIILEDYLEKFKPKVYHICSSAGYYAKLYGCETHEIEILNDDKAVKLKDIQSIFKEI